MKKILAFLLMAFTLSSCNDEFLEVEEQMKGCDGIGLWIKGEQVFKYDNNLCQYSWSPDNIEFRAFDDSVIEWFSISMDSVPSEQGDELTATLRWTTASDLRTRKNVDLSVLKKENQKIWLWSRKTGTGAIIEIVN